MNSDDHARGVHAKLFAECRQENVALKAELERERVGWKEWRVEYMDTKTENARLREQNELLRVEGTPESRAELEDALAEVEELRMIVVRVSEADDVAKAYQQVYFEDERRWQVERMKRIDAESQNARLRALVSWIDGRLVDESPHQEIRAAIYRWQETQKP